MDTNEYLPDLGLHIRQNIMEIESYSFIGIMIERIVQCDEGLFTTMVAQKWGDQKFAISFDIRYDVLSGFYRESQMADALCALQNGGKDFIFEPQVQVNVLCSLGEQVTTDNDSFIPFIASSIELL